MKNRTPKAQAEMEETKPENTSVRAGPTFSPKSHTGCGLVQTLPSGCRVWSAPRLTRSSSPSSSSSRLSRSGEASWRIPF